MSGARRGRAAAHPPSTRWSAYLGAYSEGAARLVASAPRADRDHRHPVRAGDGHASRLGIEAEERPDLRRHLLALDAIHTRPADDHVDLLLAARGLVVLAALHVRRDLEPVDADGLAAEPAAD